MSEVIENSTAETTAPADKPYTLDMVEKVYFSPAELGTDKFTETFGKTAELPNVQYNFDPSDDNGLPDNYGILIMPIQQRQGEGDNRKNVVIGATICAIPDPEFVLGSDKGRTFVRETVIDAFAVKIGNAVRPRAGGNKSGAVSIPRSLEEFIERRGGNEALKVYNELAKEVYVPALQAKGLKTLTVALLRQVLSSKAIAEATFPKIPQTQWENLLGIMGNKAKALGKDASIFAQWAATRDEMQAPEEIEDLDLSDLAGLTE